MLQAPKDWKLFMSAFIIVSIDIVVSVLLFIPDTIWNEVGFILDKEFSSTINVSVNNNNYTIQ